MLMAVIIPFDNNRKLSIKKKKKNEKKTMDILDILEYEEAINPILKTKCVQDYDDRDIRYLHRLLLKKYKVNKDEYDKIIRLIIDMKNGRFKERIRRNHD